MLNLNEDQLLDDIVYRAEQSRFSYNLQTEEFRNLNTNLQIYLNDIKRIDGENRQLQTNIDQIRTNYLITLENHLKRLPEDFRQESSTLTDAHIERYKSKSRAKRFINEREELKKRIQFLTSNDKEQAKRLNNLQKQERLIQNEFKILNDQLQNLYNHVDNEKQTCRQAMEKVDDLQIQLEKISVERSKTEFQIQTLREEVKLMQTAKEFLDEEHETIISTQTEANEYLLSRLNESISRIREDFQDLNQNQIKQIENEYKKMMNVLEEKILTNQSIDEAKINHQRIAQNEYDKIQDEYQSTSQELITLNEHNQMLSERILNMEADLYSIRDERIRELTIKDNEFERSQIELQTLSDKLNHLAEYDGNLKFELTLYRGVLEGEYRRKQQLITNQRPPRPKTLRSNRNSSGSTTRYLLEPGSKKLNVQFDDIILTINRSSDEKTENKDEYDPQENLSHQWKKSYNRNQRENIESTDVISQEVPETATETSKSPNSTVLEDRTLSSEVPFSSTISPTNREKSITSSALPIDLSDSLKTSTLTTSPPPPTLSEDQTVSSDIHQLSSTAPESRLLPTDSPVNEETPLTNVTPAQSEDHQTPPENPELSPVPSLTNPEMSNQAEETSKNLDMSSETTGSLTNLELSPQAEGSFTNPDISPEAEGSSANPGLSPQAEYPSTNLDMPSETKGSSTNPEMLSQAEGSFTNPDISSEAEGSSANPEISSKAQEPPTNSESLPQEGDSSTNEDASFIAEKSLAVSEKQQGSSEVYEPPSTQSEVKQEPSEVYQSLVTSQEEDQQLSTPSPMSEQIASETRESSTLPDNTIRPTDLSSLTSPNYQQTESDDQLSASISPNDQPMFSKSFITPSADDESITTSGIQQSSMTNKNVQKQKWLSPVDEYQTKMNTIEEQVDNENQLSKSSDEYNNNVEHEENTESSLHETSEIDNNNDHQSSNSSEPLTTQKYDNEESLSSIDLPSTENNKSITEEQISPSYDNNIEEKSKTDLISSSGYYGSLNDSIHLTDQSIPLTDMREFNSSTSLKQENQSNLEAAMEDLRYVYRELVNNEEVIEINDDFPDKLSERLEFGDNLIRTLFDSLIRKYIVEAVKAETRSNTLEWIEFRDLLFPIITSRYTEGHIRKLFELFNTNKDGYLSIEEIIELLEILQINNIDELIEDMINQFDKKLNFNEFIQTIKKVNDVNKKILSDEIESKEWYIQQPMNEEENSDISLEVPAIIFPTKIDNEISLLARIFKRVGADVENKQIDSNKPTLSMKITNEFVHNNIHISSDDLLLFIQLYLSKKQNSDCFIKWTEFRDVFYPIINGGMYSKDDITRWFDILDENQNRIINREQILHLLRLLQIPNPEEVNNKMNKICKASNDDSWILEELIFALENLDETTIHLVLTNEQITSFDLDWLTKNIF